MGGRKVANKANDQEEEEEEENEKEETVTSPSKQTETAGRGKAKVSPSPVASKQEPKKSEPPAKSAPATPSLSVNGKKRGRPSLEKSKKVDPEVEADAQPR